MNNESIENAICRVAHFEGLMQEIAGVISSDNCSAKQLLKMQASLEELKKYYDSLEWMNDYERDEAGLFPPDLKRGVLSEDGIDHLFDDAKEWISRLTGEMLGKPHRVISILPESVPEESSERYSEIEKYFLAEPNIYDIRFKYTDIILKINCYYQIIVNNSDTPFWISDPDPGDLAGWIVNNAAHHTVFVMVPEEEALFVINNDDIHMTLYNASDRLLELTGKLCSAEGVFLR